MDDRQKLREHAQQCVRQGDPTGWFERLYVEADGNPATIPWADLRANDHFTCWLAGQGGQAAGRRAVVVGCGLGDDAQLLADAGAEVTAFDISPTAIAWCRRRFAGSPVDFQTADLLALPAAWRGAFDLVVEIYTLQALPDSIRPRAAAAVASLVAPGGRLLIICRGREVDEPPGELPWPLVRSEIESLAADGLSIERFDDYYDEESPPVRRFRVEFRRRG